MLAAAALVLTLVVALGSWLALLALRGTAAPLPLGLVHGAAGLGGLVLLLLALGGPPRGLTTGTSSFGAIAAVLLALAVAPALLLFRRHRAGRPLPGGLIGLHATLAVAGFVILLAYLAVA